MEVVCVYLRPNGRPRAVIRDAPPTPARRPGRDVAATVDRLSEKYPPADRPADLGVNAVLAWLAARGEYVPVAVVRAVSGRWGRERAGAGRAGGTVAG